MKPGRIGDAIEDLLAAIGLPAVALLASLVRAWPDVAGPLLARRTAPVRLKGGVLTVRVESHAWAQELSLSRTFLLSRIGERLGPGKVTDLRFVVGQDPAGADKGDAARLPRGAEAEAGEPPLLLPGEAEGIRDPETREVLAAIARKSRFRRRGGR